MSEFLSIIFSTISTLITLYSFVCLIRILMSWLPDLEYSPAGRFIGGLCDPYLHYFKRFSFTRIGMVDFSPILALGILSVASMAFTHLARTGKITLSIILVGIIQVLWSFISFFLNILILFLVIRLIYDFVNRTGYSPFWTMLDRFLNPSITWVKSIFHQGKTAAYRISLIQTLIVMILFRIGLGFGIRLLIQIIRTLPI